MKPLSILIFLVCLTISKPYASTLSGVVTLPGGGVVAANTSFNLSLTGLTPSARYSVVCYIDTSYPFQYLLLGTNFSANTSTVFTYNINGNYLKQAELIAGHNLVIIEGLFTTPSVDTLAFTNLDQTNPFTLSNCFATPVAF